ncbi:MAG: 16S rRNA (guanine(527)-N(7))-methyltransferase RsmG [Lachnospiraceae bacterium]|nr:16S rRNA (guanine(527)-N(7))-methyltransferase RsmG [Lachnospiraceae bacterium]
MVWKMEFKDACKEWNIELTEIQAEMFEEYFRMLVSWNEKMNLTAITERDEVYVKHFLDSMSFCKVLSSLNNENYLNGEFSLIDVGTGAGFPGIPIKILYPNFKITLMDSLNKRITFLEEVVRTLKLNNVEVIHSRAEDLGHSDVYREKYDFAVSRAVANLSSLSEYCLPFVKVGGFFVSYKSEKASEEILAAKSAVFLCGGSLKDEISFVLPGTDLKRTLVVIEKKQNTSVKYPRKAGLPTKKPL